MKEAGSVGLLGPYCFLGGAGRGNPNNCLTPTPRNLRRGWEQSVMRAVGTQGVPRVGTLPVRSAFGVATAGVQGIFFSGCTPCGGTSVECFKCTP